MYIVCCEKCRHSVTFTDAEVLSLHRHRLPTKIHCSYCENSKVDPTYTGAIDSLCTIVKVEE
jgi:hypothetical protein